MKHVFLICLMALIVSACSHVQQSGVASTENTSPEWTKNAVTYQVKVCNYTPEGTLNGFLPHIPRLKELGVDIIWLTPIQAMDDHQQVNRDLGSAADLRELVRLAHEADMKVVLGWTGAYTSRSNRIFAEHPEWYMTDSVGGFISPERDTSLVYIDYDQLEAFDHMKASMEYWVREFEIDGYHCAGPSQVPVDFWMAARTSLNKIRPVLMLSDQRDQPMNGTFDVISAIDMEAGMRAVANGEQDATLLHDIMTNMADTDKINLVYTSRNDLNAGHGTVFERFGKGAETFAAMTYLIQGMPLIFGGQEVGLKSRLDGCDPIKYISWGDHPFNPLYARLNKLKKDNPALWNGQWGGQMLLLPTVAQSQVVVIFRQKKENRVLGVFNCSPEPVSFSIDTTLYHGDYKNFKTRTSQTLSSGPMTLGAWGYDVFTSR